MVAFNTLNDGSHGLTEDQIRKFAPSIFTEGQYHKLTERYRQIPTSVPLLR